MQAVYNVNAFIFVLKTVIKVFTLARARHRDVFITIKTVECACSLHAIKRLDRASVRVREKENERHSVRWKENQRELKQYQTHIGVCVCVCVVNFRFMQLYYNKPKQNKTKTAMCETMLLRMVPNSMYCMYQIQY